MLFSPIAFNKRLQLIITKDSIQKSLGISQSAGQIHETANTMTRFRPCIDLHEGKVKQIVGGTLGNEGHGLHENFVSEFPAEHFARLYANDRLTGGHVIKLGPGNDLAAMAALAAYPGGLQVGGGITIDNAQQWLDAGASHVIVTSGLFDQTGHFQLPWLKQLVAEIGAKHLVIDLSCRRIDRGWTVVMNRWQTRTDVQITPNQLDQLSEYCAEILIHAVDVEGLCRGIDVELVQLLGAWGQTPITYAGGAASLDDVRHVAELSFGKVDISIGSALDIFGGSKIRYQDLVRWNQVAGNV